MNNGQDKRFETKGVNFSLRRIPAGGPSGAPFYNLELSQHAHLREKVSAFLIMETQVTQALYEAVMGTNPSDFQDELDSPQRPVENVSWEDGIKFANALSTAMGLQPAYDGTDNDAVLIEGANGFRYPLEAEWEWAAKGGENYRYAGSDYIGETGWWWGNSGRETHPVGQLKANGYGCYDFIGNVFEWCADDSHDPGQHRPGAALRVCRGGSWSSIDHDRRYLPFRKAKKPGGRAGLRLLLP